jgi:hypothetical protein
VDCTLDEALAHIESALAASPFVPFFGSKPDHDFHLIGRALARLGSTLRPELIRSAEWSDVWLTEGSRRCRLTTDSITFVDGAEELAATCRSVDDVVSVALRFFRDLPTFAEIASDHRIVTHQ